ncbi:hypothetical protein D4764_15G0005830 [Takifugu flavidus]|uniref:Uncharacterized protein n=1 Tax=Takifugu flavidus TaxID=433684 RepID=A0A5C6P2S7_9TELE|nr:hypothetical protein D4764_15G0005830 [Takifugu flavidus]
MKHQMRDPSPWGLGKLWSTGPGGLRVLEEYRSWMSTGPGGPQVLEAYWSWRSTGPGGVQVLEVYISWRPKGPGGVQVLEVYLSWKSTGPGGLRMLEEYRSWSSTGPGGLQVSEAYVHGARLGPVRTSYVDTPVSSGPTNRRTSMKGPVQYGLGGRPRRRPWRSDPRLSSSTLGFSRSSERVASLRLRVGERVLTRLRIQAAEMSFLPREAGLSLRDRVRSSDIREELRVEPLLLHIERSQLGSARASG